MNFCTSCWLFNGLGYIHETNAWAETGEDTRKCHMVQQAPASGIPYSITGISEGGVDEKLRFLVLYDTCKTSSLKS